MKNCNDRSNTGVVSPLGQPYSLLPLLLTGLLLISLLSACSYPSIKSRDSLASDPFGGTIVDQVTGKPIANAVVMMRWPRRKGGYAGSNTVGAIEVSESVTDEEGRYFIEGWTKDKAEIFEGGFVYKSDPEMIIYANRYWPTIQRNRLHAVATTETGKRNNNDTDILQNGEVWKADWNGEAIGLKQTYSETWNPEQWEKYLSSIESYMSISYMPQCPWLKLPSYFLARDRIIRKSYRLAHPSWNHTIGSTLRSILTKWRVRSENECGVDPKYFFLSHGMTKEEFELCCLDTQDNKNKSSVM